MGSELPYAVSSLFPCRATCHGVGSFHMWLCQVCMQKRSGWGLDVTAAWQT